MLCFPLSRIIHPQQLKESTSKSNMLRKLQDDHLCLLFSVISHNILKIHINALSKINYVSISISPAYRFRYFSDKNKAILSFYWYVSRLSLSLSGRPIEIKTEAIYR